MDVLSEPEHPVENPAHSGDSEAADARPENLGAEQHGRGAWQSGDDDPLPPGAIVPGHSVQKPSCADDERGESREPAQKPQSGRKFPQADTGEERHIGNLWGLLGGKNIFGQRDDKGSEKRAGDRDDDNQQKRNSQRGLLARLTMMLMTAVMPAPPMRVNPRVLKTTAKTIRTMGSTAQPIPGMPRLSRMAGYPPFITPACGSCLARTTSLPICGRNPRRCGRWCSI